MPHSPEALLYGHLCMDRVPGTETYEAGSPAWYIAHVLEQMRMHPAVISPYGADYPREWLGSIALVPAEPTTQHTLVYENHYQPDGSRTQVAFNTETATPVDPATVQQSLWEHAQAVVVCPILDNISPDYIRTMRRLAPRAVFALLPQGYYRDIGRGGIVAAQAWETAAAIVPYFDTIFVSELDGPDMYRTAQQWSTRSRAHVVVTQAANGCVLFHDGLGLHFDAVPIANEVHPTGAGDVFAAAYLRDYLNHRNAIGAVRFAAQKAARHVAGLPLEV